MRKIAIAGLSAFLTYLLMAWRLTLLVDRKILLPAVLAAIGFALAGAAVTRLTHGGHELSLAKVALIALATPLVGTACIVLTEIGQDQELNTPEIQQVLEPLGAALARGFAGITGVAVGCLLAGIIAFLSSRIDSRATPEAPSRLMSDLGLAIGWTLASAAGAFIFLATLGDSF